MVYSPLSRSFHFPSSPEVFARRPKANRSARMLTEEDGYLKVKSKQGRKSKEPTPQAADLALAADHLAPAADHLAPAADHLAPAADHLAASYDESPPMSSMSSPLSPLITPSMPIPTIASSAKEAPKSPPPRATCTAPLPQSQEPSTSRCCPKASSPDSSSDDVSDEDDNCVVCNRRWPKNVKKTGGPKIILWARCDKCYSWVHLKYCCNRVTEPTIEEEFLCPICSVGTRKREL
ncbi:mucin-7-like [Patiria miniata]|uniref:PHD-type domain-containing protein n=1 Tax=Patiria miniata TaxID=46514 RepID=A0A914B910_PATMI|nr:mucin-7-like [Patiria miniata]